MTRQVRLSFRRRWNSQKSFRIKRTYDQHEPLKLAFAMATDYWLLFLIHATFSAPPTFLHHLLAMLLTFSIF